MRRFVELLAVLLLVCASQNTRAQNYRWEWAKQAGITGTQSGIAVASDAAGNVYVTGSISQNGNMFGATSVDSYGGLDIFIAKYNNAGTLLWVQHAGSLFDDEGKGIAVDANGDVYVTGYFNSIAIFSGTISLITVGNQDIFLAKLDGTNGAIIWAKGAGGLGADIGYAVTTTGSKVYFSGSFSGLSNFGLLLEISGGQTDAFVAGYNAADGSETWVRSGSTSRDDVALGIASDASGVYACGYYGDAAATFQNISGSLTNIGQEDIFLVKYDPSGNGLWKKNAGSSTSGDGGASLCLSGTSLYLAGYFQGTINFFNVPGPSSYAVASGPNEDGLLASFNTGTGNINWAVTTGGTNLDRATGVTVNTVGDVFITGNFKATLPGPALTSSGGNDVFVLKYNSAGVLQSGLQAGGSSDELGHGICANGISGVFVTGSFSSSTAPFSTNTISNAGNEDIFIAKTNCEAIPGTATALSGMACNNDSTTVILAGSAGNIQWQYSPSPAGTWTNIPGATNDTARVPVLGVSDYRALISFTGCASVVSGTVTVNNYPVPVALAGADQFTCFSTAVLAGNNPSVGSGTWISLGSATVQSPASFNSTVSGLTTGANLFVWQVTDAVCNVTAADTMNVFAYATPAIITTASPDSICSGASSTLNASGSSTYLWIPGNGTGSSIVVSPVTTTTYTVTGTTVDGCQATAQVTVHVDAVPVFSVSAADDTICRGFSTTLTASGSAASYSWMPGNFNTATISVTPSTTTTYAVTGINGVCALTHPLTITVNSLPLIAASASQDTICFGGSTVLSGSGAATLVWMPGNLNGTPQTVTPAAATTYTLTGTDTNGCVDSAQVSIMVNPLPVVSANANPAVICEGQTTILSAGGGTNYVWNGGTLANASGSTQTDAPVTNATYSVVITSNFGCVDSTTVSLTVNPLPLVNAGNDTTICSGNPALLHATGGVSWSWNGGALVNANGATQTVSPLITTTYVVTATTSAGCSANDTVIVFVNTTPIANAGNDTTICSGNPAVLNGAGGNSWTWNGGALVNANGATQTVTPLITTTYVLTATTSAGCAANDTVIVFVNPTPVANAGNDTTICSGNTVVLNGSGGNSWTWNGGALVNANGATQTVTPAATTTYVLTATTSAGCSANDTVIVFVNPTPVAYAGNDTTICSGNPVVLNGTGGNSWTWNGGALVNANGATQTVVPLITTTYVLTATTSAGCSANDTVVVFVNPTPVAYAGNDTTICSGNPVVLNGTGGNSWTWNGGALVNANGATQTVTPVTTTTYVLTATTAAGCSANDTVIVFVNPTPVANAGNDTTICSGNPVLLNASGGNSWLWNGGSLVNAAGAMQTVIPAITTTYTVSATTSAGCSAIDSIIVFVNPAPVANAGNDTTICSGNAASLNATGGSSWTWNGGSLVNANGAAQTVVPLSTVTYTVTATTGAGCSANDSITVNVNPLPLLNAGVDTSLCTGDTIQLHASGTGSFLWTPSAALSSNSAADPFAWPVITSTYTVTLTDANGCTNADTISISVFTIPVPSVSNDTLVCSGSSCTILSNGGNTYQWNGGTLSNASGASQLVSPAANTTYTVLVTSADGCTAMDSVTISVDQQPSVASAGMDSALCSASFVMNANTPVTGTGTWNVVASPGTFANPSQSNTNVNGLATGQNVFEWIITNGVCPASHDTVVINVDQPASTAVAGPDLDICSDSVYMQALVPAAGTGSWINISAVGNFADPSSAQSLVSNIPAGSFQYVWTVTNGACSSLPDTMTITVYANPSTAAAGPDQMIYTTTATMNALAPSSGTGTWTRISGSGTCTDVNDPATTITQLETGTSVFRWTVSNGNCVSTFDDVQVTREAVFIPTGFSPNGDGANDFFVIPGIESFPAVKVQVFNRWGVIVYASDDYHNDWDGTRLNGEKLPEDVYYYVIELGEANEVSGHVALKRSQL